MKKAPKRSLAWMDRLVPLTLTIDRRVAKRLAAAGVIDPLGDSGGFFIGAGPARDVVTGILVDRAIGHVERTPRNVTYRVSRDSDLPAPCLPTDHEGRRRRRDGKTFLTLAQAAKQVPTLTRQQLFDLWCSTMTDIGH